MDIYRIDDRTDVVALGLTVSPREAVALRAVLSAVSEVELEDDGAAPDVARRIMCDTTPMFRQLRDALTDLGYGRTIDIVARARRAAANIQTRNDS